MKSSLPNLDKLHVAEPAATSFITRTISWGLKFDSFSILE